MKKELPNYVFERKYDRFFLATEFDVIFNEGFTEKMNLFLSTLQTEKLFIQLDAPTDYESKLPDKIEIVKPESLSIFYEMQTASDGLYYYMIDFFISDESESWEIYVSLENELSIIACSIDVSSIFELIFKPYEEENLIKKYKIITDMFGDEYKKEQFIKSLEENYQFSALK